MYLTAVAYKPIYGLLVTVLEELLKPYFLYVTEIVLKTAINSRLLLCSGLACSNINDVGIRISDGISVHLNVTQVLLVASVTEHKTFWCPFQCSLNRV
jgi:hypothetical protein